MPTILNGTTSSVSKSPCNVWNCLCSRVRFLGHMYYAWTGCCDGCLESRNHSRGNVLLPDTLVGGARVRTNRTTLTFRWQKKMPVTWSTSTLPVSPFAIFFLKRYNSVHNIAKLSEEIEITHCLLFVNENYRNTMVDSSHFYGYKYSENLLTVTTRGENHSTDCDFALSLFKQRCLIFWCSK